MDRRRMGVQCGRGFGKIVGRRGGTGGMRMGE